jgi:hypothetical protein
MKKIIELSLSSFLMGNNSRPSAVSPLYTSLIAQTYAYLPIFRRYCAFSPSGVPIQSFPVHLTCSHIYLRPQKLSQSSECRDKICTTDNFSLIGMGRAQKEKDKTSIAALSTAVPVTCKTTSKMLQV